MWNLHVVGLCVEPDQSVTFQPSKRHHPVQDLLFNHVRRRALGLSESSMKGGDHGCDHGRISFSFCDESCLQHELGGCAVAVPSYMRDQVAE